MPRSGTESRDLSHPHTVSYVHLFIHERLGVWVHCHKCKTFLRELEDAADWVNMYWCERFQINTATCSHIPAGTLLCANLFSSGCREVCNVGALCYETISELDFFKNSPNSAFPPMVNAELQEEAYGVLHRVGVLAVHAWECPVSDATHTLPHPYNPSETLHMMRTISDSAIQKARPTTGWYEATCRVPSCKCYRISRVCDEESDDDDW